MARSSEPRIVLGHVASAHGIRGDVTIKSYTENPVDIAAYGALSDEAGGRPLTISQVRQSAKGLIAHFAGVDDRTKAEALRGRVLTVARSALPPAEDGAYYHVDLIGLSAVAPEGEAIGEVVAVQDFGGGTMLEIAPVGGGQTELIPFTDGFVPVVDISGGRVVVNRPILVDGPELDDAERPQE